MTQKRIINFDTIYSTKINNNPFLVNFVLTETLRNVSKLILKSIEIPISNYNVRSPYSTIQIKYNNNDTVTINLFSSVVDSEKTGHISVEDIYV